MKLRKIYALLIFLYLPFLQPLIAAEDDFVEVACVDSTIIIELKYATPNNFFGKVLYDSDRCFLRRATVERLVRVQQALRQNGLGLKIWDGYRPHSVQFEMWKLMPNPDFVGDPQKGSKHNRGAAVDVTLVDSLGNELPMPTEYDDFSEKARRNYLDLPVSIIKNRQILENAMTMAGFIPLASEWWHFDDPQWRQFELTNISIKELIEKTDQSERIGK